MLKDILRLISGTLGGRLILLAVLPFSTRLYSPEDFAILSVYLSVVSTLAVVACLRFDIAILIAPDDEDAVGLLALAVLSAGAVAALSAIPTLLFQVHVAGLNWSACHCALSVAGASRSANVGVLFGTAVLGRAH